MFRVEVETSRPETVVEYQSNPFFLVGLDDEGRTNGARAIELIAANLDKMSLVCLRTVSVVNYLQIEDTWAATHHHITRWGDPSKDGLLRDGQRMWMINYMQLHLDRGLIVRLIHTDMDDDELDRDILLKVESLAQLNHFAWKVAVKSDMLHSQRHCLWPPSFGREISMRRFTPNFFVPRAFPQKRAKLMRAFDDIQTQKKLLNSMDKSDHFTFSP